MVMHLAALPDQRASSNPEGPCLADGRHDLDNATFAARYTACPLRLVEFGIGPGDVVGVILPNCVELITITFAAWRAGARADAGEPGAHGS